MGTRIVVSLNVSWLDANLHLAFNFLCKVHKKTLTQLVSRILRLIPGININK